MSDEMYKVVIGLLIAICLIILGANRRRKRNQLKSTGLLADGIIFEVVSESSLRITIGNSTNQSTRLYYPVIRFVTADMEWVTERYHLGREYGHYKEGNTVKVIYNHQNPKDFMLDDWSYKFDIGLIMLIFGLLGAITATIFMLMIYGAGMN